MTDWKDFERLRIGWRQVPAEGVGDVPAAIEVLQRVQTAASIVRECTGR
jgi:hypothetical protein